MIRYVQGNLLESHAEAVVNTVNEVGVMGKGLALQVRDAFPESSGEYIRACKRGDVRVGRMFVTRSSALVGPTWIIHFPTKKHWRDPSQLAWVCDGLDDLVRVVRELGIRSIAIPPLGCGNGGLDWTDVRREIERAFAPFVDVEVQAHEPTGSQTNPPRGVDV
ncbi:MAG: macro domain-containing protein [Planctomycetes bacterium]|nr:macro domain-containing protein [Planctomycetota bacterium]